MVCGKPTIHFAFRLSPEVDLQAPSVLQRVSAEIKPTLRRCLRANPQATSFSWTTGLFAVQAWKLSDRPWNGEEIELIYAGSPAAGSAGSRSRRRSGRVLLPLVMLIAAAGLVAWRTRKATPTPVVRTLAGSRLAPNALQSHAGKLAAHPTGQPKAVATTATPAPHRASQPRATSARPGGGSPNRPAMGRRHLVRHVARHHGVTRRKPAIVARRRYPHPTSSWHRWPRRAHRSWSPHPWTGCARAEREFTWEVVIPLGPADTTTTYYLEEVR